MTQSRLRRLALGQHQQRISGMTSCWQSVKHDSSLIKREENLEHGHFEPHFPLFNLVGRRSDHGPNDLRNSVWN